MAPLRVWFAETRPHFLPCSLVFVQAGVSLAIFEGYAIRVFDLAMTVLGAMLAQISVNVLDDYYDYTSGIDLMAERTSLSGGSGLLASGKLKPLHVYFFGMLCLAGVVVVGAYFVATIGVEMIPVGVIGIVLVYTYTNRLTKIGLGEFACGLGFALMSIGAYVVQARTFSTSIFLVAMISAFLMFNILLLNEFPDVNADRFGKRRNIPIALGLKRSSLIFCTVIVLILVYLATLVLAKCLPLHALAALGALPLASMAAKGGLRHFNNPNRLANYLQAYFVFTILFPFLMSTGMVAATIRI